MECGWGRRHRGCVLWLCPWLWLVLVLGCSSVPTTADFLMRNPLCAGNMQRFVDVFDASTGAMAAQVGSAVGSTVLPFGRTVGRVQALKIPQHTVPNTSFPLALAARLQLSSEHMTAIASRNAAHPALPVLASATNSGRIHIYRA